MSKKKAAGKSRQQKRTSGKRLGVKVSDGETVNPGMVLVRQRGTLYRAGRGVSVGRDHSLFAKTQGVVKFGVKFGRTTVSLN